MIMILILTPRPIYVCVYVCILYVYIYIYIYICACVYTHTHVFITCIPIPNSSTDRHPEVRMHHTRMGPATQEPFAFDSYPRWAKGTIPRHMNPQARGEHA